MQRAVYPKDLRSAWEEGRKYTDMAFTLEELTVQWESDQYVNKYNIVRGTLIYQILWAYGDTGKGGINFMQENQGNYTEDVRKYLNLNTLAALPDTKEAKRRR